ncbi:MAG: LapA family protein [Desulfobacterota bacterium]|nr:LapA family protein [Thermodesulfobacteriota bacterium]
MYFSLILSFLIILGITVFALQNGMLLEVNFLFWSFKTSLIAVILGSALTGVFLISLFLVPLLIKKHFREKRFNRQIMELERQTLSKIHPSKIDQITENSA